MLTLIKRAIAAVLNRIEDAVTLRGTAVSSSAWHVAPAHLQGQVVAPVMALDAAAEPLFAHREEFAQSAGVHGPVRKTHASTKPWMHRMKWRLIGAW